MDTLSSSLSSDFGGEMLTTRELSELCNHCGRKRGKHRAFTDECPGTWGTRSRRFDPSGCFDERGRARGLQT